MDFPNTFDEFANEYGFKDKDEVYTNGSELISVFRVKQWLDHISTTKNDLGVDAISRAEVQAKIEMNASRYSIAKERGGMGKVEWSDQLIKVSDAVDIIRNLPPVTPIRPKHCPNYGSDNRDVDESEEVMSKKDELEFLKYDLENMIAIMMECENMLSHEEKTHLSLHRRCLSILNRIEPQESENNE